MPLVTKPFRSVGDFCRRNNISRSTFYRQLHSGHLKASKLGSRTVISTTEELRWRAAVRAQAWTPTEER